MRTTAVSILVASLWSLAAASAIAQDDGGNVVTIHCFDVEPNARASFEEGVKKHHDWHRQQNDTWTWVAWEVLTGPQSGRLCGGSFDHKWEDFDSPAVPEDADAEHIAATFGPHFGAHEATFWVRLADVSRPADEPAPMTSVIFFRTHFGMEARFQYLVKEFHEAIQETDMPWRYNWYALVSGGEGGTYALGLPLANYAGFNPTGKPFPEMLEEAFGEAKADALLADWNEVVAGSEIQLVKGRPDLSYIPASP